MKVFIPSPLLSYTKSPEVEARGSTLAEILKDLDKTYPGFRVRVVDEKEHLRPHIRFFVNGEQVFDIARRLDPSDDVQLVQTLSGG